MDRREYVPVDPFAVSKSSGRGVIVDIGTGDGRFVYELAKKNPSKFVVGVDSNHENLIERSARIYKRPSRGGISNALFALASANELPVELNGLANQVFMENPKTLYQVEHSYNSMKQENLLNESFVLLGELLDENDELIVDTILLLEELALNDSWFNQNIDPAFLLLLGKLTKADIAKSLRVLVRDRIKTGDDNQQVLDYITQRYGDSILLRPPLNSSTFIPLPPRVFVAMDDGLRTSLVHRPVSLVHRYLPSVLLSSAPRGMPTGPRRGPG